MQFVVKHPETGARLCGDNRWREFAHFGTFRSCVKTYKTMCGLRTAMDRLRILEWEAIGLGTKANGVTVSMDASGNITHTAGVY